MKYLINRLYHHPVFAKLIHTLVNELQKELRGYNSVIDLGCGPSSPLQFCPWIKDSIGVEEFEPYLEKSKAKKIHAAYIKSRLEDLEFDEKCVDAVILIDVLEHLPEEVGYKILRKAEQWAKYKVIISSPNGFIEQSALDGNELQKHLSGWDYKTMKSLGYKSRGMAGPKWLRTEVEGETMGDDLLTSIRLQPKAFWFLVATLLQPICYYLPITAYSLLSTKKLNRALGQD